MHNIIKTVRKPTIIENCIFTHLLSPDYKHLVLSGSNNLYIYEILFNLDIDDYSLNAVANFSFLENIVCLEVIKFSDYDNNGIILGFQDAKFSIIQVDPSDFSLKTLSVHNFETEDFKNGFYNCLYMVKVKRDPKNQCVAMSFYNHYIAILPLSLAYESIVSKNNDYAELFGDELGILPEISSNISMQFKLPSSIVINIKQILPKVTNVLDITFLNGYYEPTLLILYEPFQTWAGKVTLRQETVCMVALSINLSQRAYPIIWSMTNLPYDAIGLAPVPAPLGGTLVLAANSILYLNQRKSVPVATLALNRLAPPEYTRPKDRELALTLGQGSCHAIFLDPYTVIVSTGATSCDFLSSRYSILRFTAKSSGGHTPSSTLGENGFKTDLPLSSEDVDLMLEICDKFPAPYTYLQATDMCYCGNNLIFVASHISDSALLSVERASPHIKTETPNDGVYMELEGEALFQRTLSSSTSTATSPQLATASLNETFSFENSTLEKLANLPIPAFTFKIFDKIINIGPCTRFSLGFPQVNCQDFYPNSQQDNESLADLPKMVNEFGDPDLEMVLTTGKDESGGIALLQKSIIPQLITTFNLPGVLNMWTLYGTSQIQETPEESEFNTFLLLTMHNSTLVLKTGVEITELEQHGFNIQAPTLIAGNFIINNPASKKRVYYIIQVTPVDIRLLKGDELLQDLAFDAHGISSSPITAAYLCYPYVLLQDENSQLTILTLIHPVAAKNLLLNSNKYTNEFDESVIKGGDNIHPQLQISHGSLHKVPPKPPICAINLYRDSSGLFNTKHSLVTYYDTSAENIYKKMATLKEVNGRKESKSSNIAENREFKSEFAKDVGPIKFPDPLTYSTSILTNTNSNNNNNADEDDILLYGDEEMAHSKKTKVKIEHEEIINENMEWAANVKEELNLNVINTSRDKQKLYAKTGKTQRINGYRNSNQYVICKDLKGLQSTYWAIICRINGSLEIYSIPTFHLCYQIANFHLKMNGLSDEVLFTPVRDIHDGIITTPKKKRKRSHEDKPLQADDDVSQNLLDTYQVREISLVGIEFSRHPNQEYHNSKNPSNTSYTKIIKPYLLAQINEHIVIYEAYSFANPNNQIVSTSPQKSNLNLKPNKECLDITCGTAHTNSVIDSDMSHLAKRLNIRFRKIEHNMLLGERKAAKTLPKKDAFHRLFSVLRSTSLIRSFNNVNASSGILIQGLIPHWIFPGPHGDLKIHPMTRDGPIYAFTPFHNVNCPRGFLYFNYKDELRVCLLSNHLNYDQDWPTRKFALGSTVHFIEYHMKMKVYVLVTSRKYRPKQKVKCLNNYNTAAAFATLNTGGLASRNVPNVSLDESHNLVTVNTASATGRIMTTEEGGVVIEDEILEEKEMEDLDTDPFFPPPHLDEFTIELIDPISWSLVPSARLNLNSDWERITAFKQIALTCPGSVTGLKDYLVVGTACVYGEDMACRGRLFIIDIIEVVPEPGKPLTRYKIKIICLSEQKGPIIDIAGVSGNLVTVIGQKIYVWNLNNNNELIGQAFVDTSLCVHTIATVKNLLIVGDLHKSVTFMRYDPLTKSIAIASKDYSFLSVYGIEYLVDNEKLGFVASDRLKNIVIFTYQPQARESYGGQKLVRKGDIHMGTSITSFFRLYCRRKDPSSDKKPSLALERKQTTYFIGLDGRIGYILPLNEKLYRRLVALQNFMDSNLFYFCGLNPKLSRTFKFPRKQLVNPAHSILDGNQLFKFFHLNALQQDLISKNCGVSVDQIIDDFMEIDRTTSHF